MRKLQGLLDQALVQRSGSLQERELANLAAAQVIRGVEQALLDALGGDAVMGLPNLLPEEGAVKYYGYRLNVGGMVGRSQPLPKEFGASSVMVLNKNARVVYAWRAMCPSTGKVYANERPVPDLDLRADLLEPYIRLVQEVLEDHLLKASRRAESYRATRELADKIAAAIGLKMRI